MKLKYYLRGLGTGVLFATLILFISYTYHNTDAQIKKRAKELGMIEASETTTHIIDNITDADTDDTTSDKESTKDITDSSEENSSLQDENQSKEDTTQNTTVSSEIETTTVDNIKTEYEFTIISGMGSAQVAQLLYSAGIIDSTNDFDRYLVSNGYAERIRTGTYKVSAGSSYLDIALLITN